MKFGFEGSGSGAIKPAGAPLTMKTLHTQVFLWVTRPNQCLEILISNRPSLNTPSLIIVIIIGVGEWRDCHFFIYNNHPDLGGASFRVDTPYWKLAIEH